MALFKSCRLVSALPKCEVIFQGHYINRSVGDRIQCQCYFDIQQKRNFFNLSQESRKREYCGRQLLGYTMHEMYEVVSDVESYHSFVPWCKRSVVISKYPGKLTAELVVGFPPIHESYISNVTLIKPHLVKAESSSRLFHYLLTLWRFSPGLKREQRSCVVDFRIAFEFRSAFHSQLSNAFFDHVARKMENAFIAEAGRRFGNASIQPVNLLESSQAIKS